MSGFQTIILAAGKGTRMKSSLAKVLHKVDGREMVRLPVEAARACGSSSIILIVGHQGEDVARIFQGEDVKVVFQHEQNGTGHAVKCASEAASHSGDILILCGDVPLIRFETLTSFMAAHKGSGSAVTVMTTHVADPTGYGRIIREADNRISCIVEEKDASSEQKKISEINTGIYIVKGDFLFEAVENLSCSNAQGEYYLTDIIDIANSRTSPPQAFVIEDEIEVMGINDRIQLAKANAVFRQRVNESLMKSGVTIIDPANTYIESSVSIGADSIIYPNCVITGGSVIGEGCVIESSVTISSSRILAGAHIKAGSVIEDSSVGKSASVGPMAHLRPGTILGDEVKIGNFVETKKITMGKGSKASHLTYLGDAEIGEDVNIGCGTITCNYDGVRKHRTVIGDRVFVGSDVQFVAPVTIGENSLIAAGTTVTKDVPPDSLVLARVPQVNKEGWVKRKSAEKK